MTLLKAGLMALVSFVSASAACASSVVTVEFGLTAIGSFLLSPLPAFQTGAGATTVSHVPLPAGAWPMLGGLGLLGAVRARRGAPAFVAIQ